MVPNLFKRSQSSEQALHFHIKAHLYIMAIAVVSAQDPVVFNTSSTLLGTLTDCGTSGPPSCGGDPSNQNLCCYEYPGGLLLQTQFWDTRPPTGPADSWTIHGLWPDNCDGSHASNCDTSRDYTDIPRLLKEQGADDTLSFMDRYWVDIHGRNERFWEHEWSTHGTCYSTLQPSCLPGDSPRGAEAVIFFRRVVELFKQLPTYEWLASQGITPSESQTYALSDITSALKAASGYTPAVACSGRAINQISYYFYVKGSLIDGEFVPIDAPIDSSCASSNLHYYPKSGGR